MDSTTGIVADLTTIATGGTLFAGFLSKVRPSKNVEKTEKYLQASMVTLTQHKDKMPRKEVRELHTGYKR